MNAGQNCAGTSGPRFRKEYRNCNDEVVCPGPQAASPCFVHVVFKRLSAVEADPARSNQHEFNGTNPLRAAFGLKPRRVRTDFVWMPDDGDWISASDELTWYDARAMHPTRTEYRLYYRANPVTLRAAAGDILLLALRSDRTALALVAPGSGLAAARIFWLFGIEVAPGAGFAALDLDPAAQHAIAGRLGIAERPVDDDWSSEQQAQASTGDPGLRDETALIQRLVGAGATGHADDDGDDWLPERVPEALGGAALGRTIRGIVAPGHRSRTRKHDRGIAPRETAPECQAGVT